MFLKSSLVAEEPDTWSTCTATVCTDEVSVHYLGRERQGTPRSDNERASNIGLAVEYKYAQPTMLNTIYIHWLPLNKYYTPSYSSKEFVNP